MKNKVKQLLDARGMSRYRFWKLTGISRPTAYDLYDDPFYVPRETVMEAICRALKVQPGDFLEYVEEDDRDAEV